MSYLGHMVWWKVGHPDRRASDVAPAAQALGIDMPSAPIPVDVFRRLSSLATTYDLDDDHTVVLDLHRATSQRTMLVRHIVRTVRKNGIVTAADRVGEAAFYRPPKGQHHRARMRVTINPEAHPDKENIEEYAAALRTEYSRQLDALDPQAVRRMVRSYLSSVGALYLQGPYFVPDLDDVVRLERLFDVVGGGSTVMHIPVVDDERLRAMVETARADQQYEKEDQDGTEH